MGGEYRVSSTFGCPATCRMPLSCPVTLVVSISAKEKMLRINTLANVAFMKNIQSIWNRASVDSPRDSMRNDSVPFFSANVKHAIPIGVGCADPEPAILSFVNRVPKALFDWNHERFWASSETLFSCIARPKAFLAAILFVTITRTENALAL